MPSLQYMSWKQIGEVRKLFEEVVQNSLGFSRADLNVSTSSGDYISEVIQHMWLGFLTRARLKENVDKLECVGYVKTAVDAKSGASVVAFSTVPQPDFAPVIFDPTYVKPPV
jgi:hypothetical protein